jgi:hypothetical protein
MLIWNIEEFVELQQLFPVRIIYYILQEAIKYYSYENIVQTAED